MNCMYINLFLQYKNIHYTNDCCCMFDILFQHKYIDVCCWMRNYLNHEMELELSDGTEYKDEGVMEEKKHYDDVVLAFQSMSIREFATDVQTIVLSGLSKAMSPLREWKDALLQYLTGQQNSTRHLVTASIGNRSILLKQLKCVAFRILSCMYSLT